MTKGGYVSAAARSGAGDVVLSQQGEIISRFCYRDTCRNGSGLVQMLFHALNRVVWDRIN